MSKNKRNRRQGIVSAHSNLAELTPANKQKHSIKQLSGKILPGVKARSHWWAVGLVAFLSLGVLGAGLKYLEDAALEQKVKQQQNPSAENESFLTKLNLFMPAPTPTATPQISKEYVYAGSRMLAVEDQGANLVPPADLAVWRPSNGTWYCLGGAAGSQSFTVAWGMNGDVPVQGDYDGDGKTDLAIFRPGTNYWWIYPSNGSSYYALPLGTSGDITVPADYDGDGKTDPAVFRPSTNYWYIVQSSTQSTVSVQFGSNGDVPAPADYDGDGKADPSTYRNGSAAFYTLKSSSGQTVSQSLGASGDRPMPGDYDGDGKADFALRPNGSSNWIIKQSSNGQVVTVSWQQPNDISVQNDYDGDGKVDIAVWRPAGKGVGNWFIRQSSRIGQSDELRPEAWGTTGDVPVPSLYRR
jgi:hypothetical protein